MKIWQLHTVNPIGLIFGYFVAPIVLYLPTKFQPPTSFTFSVIGDRGNQLLIARKKSFSRLLPQDSDFPETLHATQAGIAIDEF